MATNSQVLPPLWQRAANDTTEVTSEESTADRTVDGAFASFLAGSMAVREVSRTIEANRHPATQIAPNTPNRESTGPEPDGCTADMHLGLTPFVATSIRRIANPFDMRWSARIQLPCSLDCFLLRGLYRTRSA